MYTINTESRNRGGQSIPSAMSVRSAHSHADLDPRNQVPMLDLSFTFEDVIEESELPSYSEFFSYFIPKGDHKRGEMLPAIRTYNHSEPTTTDESGSLAETDNSRHEYSTSKSDENGTGVTELKSGSPTTAKLEDIDENDLKAEYLRLVKIGNENVNNILRKDSELETQDKLMEELMAESVIVSATNLRMTREVTQARKFHENFRQEAQRLRVAHKTNEIGAIIISNDNTNLQEHIWKIREEVMEVNERRCYRGVAGLKAKARYIHEATTREHADNELLEERITALKNEVNDYKCASVNDAPDDNGNVNSKLLKNFIKLKPHIHRRPNLLTKRTHISNDKLTKVDATSESATRGATRCILPPIKKSNTQNVVSSPIVTPRPPTTIGHKPGIVPRPPTAAPSDRTFQRKNIKR